MARDKHLQILDRLPSEFRARDYKALMGPHISSASGMLHHLQHKSLIERIGLGLYRKLNRADSPTAREQASAEILDHCLDPILPADHPSKLSDDLSAVGSLFDSISTVLAENNRLREENSELRGTCDRLREESTWLTAEINRWAQIARAAKQIPIGRTACEH